MEAIVICAVVAGLVIAARIWSVGSDYIDIRVKEATTLAKMDARESVQRRLDKIQEKYRKNGLISFDDIEDAADIEIKPTAKTEK